MLPTMRFRLATWSIVAVLLVACSPVRRESTAGTRAVDGGAEAAPRTTEEPLRVARRDAVPAPVVPAAIATGPERETNFRIGRDLAAFVAPDAGVALDVVATKGSADNIHRLQDDPRVDLAIVQYDVMQAFMDAAAGGDAAARQLVRSLRVVTPLYTEEMYFVTRSDSPMRSIHQIRGKRINVGLQGSGSALTVASLYRRMFGVSLPARDASHLGDEEALAALTVAKSVDVVVVVAAQPARLFAEMKPEARRYIKLLALDPRNVASREAFKAYFPATIRRRSYASWLGDDVPTLSVMSFLVVRDLQGRPLAPRLVAFARSLCTNLPTLRTRGHPKWREVPLGQQFGDRWNYDAVSVAAFAQCAERPAS